MEIIDPSNPLKRPRKNVKSEGARSKLSSLRDKSKPSQTSSVNDLRIIPLVALSEYDKAAQLLLCKDQLICTGCEGGFRMVRATHGVHRGSYYWEMEVLHPLEDSEKCHVRVGWSTRQGELQAPVGFDQYSFCYRDLNGSRVHKSERYDDYGASFGPGDVIGCFISLDESGLQNKMIFFKNGVSQGEAYSGKDIPPAVYFPAVSLFNKAVVRVNFGPSFIVRGHDIFGANAVSELQPMNPDDRKLHEQLITSLREGRERGDKSEKEQQQM